MKNIVLPLVLFMAFMATAQDGTEKLLKGRITSENKDVVGVVVQNVSNGEAVITDFEGNFAISVQLNDTLEFSAVHFVKKTLRVSELMYHTDFVEVPMQEFVNELKEVVVRPYDLSGDLNQDVGKLTLEKDVSAEALKLPNAHVKIITQSERRLQEASSGMYSISKPFRVGLNPIINAITGRTKMLKNRVEVDNTYAQTQEVQNYYADSLFVSVLKIPMEKIEDFMYFCEVDEDFQSTVDSQDKLKIWGFLLEKSRAYRKNNHIE